MAGLTSVFYNVRDFGAAGDGTTKDTAAIAKAITAASAAGGGTVFFPAGNYLSGTIELRSNIAMRLEPGATILGSGDFDDFPIMPAGTVTGFARPWRKGLIWALDAENISLVGGGTIDGQGWHWWKWAKMWSRFRKAGVASAPPGQEEDFAIARRVGATERPRMIEFLRCRRIRVDGLRLQNSMTWTLHPTCCEDVVINGLTLINPPDSPNTDGINPESCRNVRIANCHIDVGDDCVTIKSGKEDDPFRSSMPCENITVTNCTMIHGHGGVVIGSEMSGGVRHVAISNCVFNGTDRGIRIKTCRGRGASVEDVAVSNIVMKDVRSVVQFTMFYTGTHLDPAPDAHRVAHEPVTPATPQFRNFHISNVVATGCNDAGYIAGLPEMPIEGVSFSHMRISSNKPCFATRVKGLTFHDVQISTQEGPAIVCEDAQDVDIASLRFDKPKPGASAIEMTAVRGAFIRDCTCPAGAAALLKLRGNTNKDIVVGVNNLAPDIQTVTLADGALADAVKKPS